jgi:hypothetical protein
MGRPQSIMTFIRYLYNTVQPEFDIAKEYMELFYKQFIICLGMTVFPLITLLGMLSYILEYMLDRYFHVDK